MPRANKVTQEFYCGECGGYFLATLNMALNFEVEIVCPGPDCGHEHRRCVVDGQILEQGRFATDSKEKIRPTSASYSKEPLTTKMRARHKEEKNGGYCGGRRDGELVTEPMFDRWLEIAARERGEGNDNGDD